MDIKKPTTPARPRGRPRTREIPAPPEPETSWVITPEIVERILEAEQEE